jgi:hypothetical protein
LCILNAFYTSLSVFAAFHHIDTIKRVGTTAKNTVRKVKPTVRVPELLDATDWTAREI